SCILTQETDMAKNWKPKSYWSIPLPDGTYGYGRLLDFPYASFLNVRTDKPRGAMTELAAADRLFSVAAHESALKRWTRIGEDSRASAQDQPPKTFIQDEQDPNRCQIYDESGNGRPATPAECVDLERAAVWNPQQVERRLLDALLGVPNADVESIRVKLW